MNVLLWILQVLLALHTLMGAVWKVSNSEQSVPSLRALPHGAWLAMGFFEVLCALGLILSVIKPLAILAPVAAAGISAEMLLFCGLHVRSGQAQHGPMVYWLVAAALSAFLAYGRFVLEPLFLD